MRIRIRLNDKVDADIIEQLSRFGSRDQCEESRALLRMGYLVKYGSVGELINSQEGTGRNNEVPVDATDDDIHVEASVEPIREAPKAKVDTNVNSALRSALLSANLNP